MSTETAESPSSALVISPAFELDEKSATELQSAFTPIHEEALKWITGAKAIVITDVSQVREMKLARETRLALKGIRVKAEKRHKELKQGVLLKGRAIDGILNIIKAEIELAEAHLLEQEKFSERLEEKRKSELKTHRDALLVPFGVNTQFYQLGEMPDDQFQALYDGAKAAHEAKIAAAKKAEEDRIAKEKADAEERERVGIENERLKKEAQEREVQAAKERSDAAAAAEKARIEREAAETKIRAEAAKEKAEAEAKAKAAAEKARKEKEAIEAEAKAEREKAEAAAKSEREARLKAEAELKAKADTEAKAAAEKEAARGSALMAPEKEQLQALANRVRELLIPMMKTASGKRAIKGVESEIIKLARYIERKAQELDGGELL